MIHERKISSRKGESYMIEVEKRYWFSYEVQEDDEEENQILIHNHGLNCTVIAKDRKTKQGRLWEVRSDTGSEFTVFEKELKEIKL